MFQHFSHLFLHIWIRLSSCWTARSFIIYTSTLHNTHKNPDFLCFPFHKLLTFSNVSSIFLDVIEALMLIFCSSKLSSVFSWQTTNKNTLYKYKVYCNTKIECPKLYNTKFLNPVLTWFRIHQLSNVVSAYRTSI
jgi:hypothetical protein